MRYKFTDAIAVAGEIVSWLKPYCKKIMIAGSLRREKAEVGDIEILCIPRLGYRDEVHYRIMYLIRNRFLDYRLNKKGSRTYGKQNKLLVHCESGIPLDVFSVSEEAWAMGLLIRTGSKMFNIRLCMQAKKLGFHIKPYSGIIDQRGNLLKPKTEEEIFELLKLDYISPEKRI